MQPNADSRESEALMLSRAYEREKPVTSAKKTKSRQGCGYDTVRTLLPWIWEIVCGAISISVMVALVAVLKAYDGLPLSEWEASISAGAYSFNISINFIVSALGTIGKAALTVCVAAGISQAKWVWFAKAKRSLLDYKTFDDASRGPLGSARLLRVTKFW